MLADLDLQSGDVASCLDVRFRRSVADLAGIEDLTPRVLQDAVYPHETGLGLLLAPDEGERGEDVDERTARQLVAALRSQYQTVVLDCGSQMHAGNAAAVEAADVALLLTTPDVLAVRGAKRMVRMWDRLRIRTAEETVVVVNRASRHAEIQPQLVARITGSPVARTTVPAHFKELQSALDAGRMQDLDPKGGVRQALWALAGELGLAAGPNGEPPRAPRGPAPDPRRRPRRWPGRRRPERGRGGRTQTRARPAGAAGAAARPGLRHRALARPAPTAEPRAALAAGCRRREPAVGGAATAAR